MAKASLTLWLVLAVLAVVVVFLLLNRPRKVIVDAPIPADFPKASFSHDSFEELLRLYVTPAGRVDYDRWHESGDSTAQLDSYLAAVARFSPDSSPERFADDNERLAYWMYGYNACVIKGVLDNWPLSSVTDVKAPIEAIKGMGFFYQLRFSFGGEYLSLLTVENEKIRARFRDPRIHFVLNCASESCPVARPELPSGDELQRLLDQATDEFVNDPDNVSVDHDRNTVYLSTIFKWYRKDFINDLHARGRPASRGLIDYVATVATGSLQSDLERANDYAIVFREYDWRLNESQ